MSLSDQEILILTLLFPKAMLLDGFFATLPLK